jgi:hypothetical protein
MIRRRDIIDGIATQNRSGQSGQVNELQANVSDGLSVAGAARLVAAGSCRIDDCLMARKHSQTEHFR